MTGPLPEPALEQVEREVDAGADTGGAEDRPFIDDLAADHVDVRELRPERGQCQAVGGRPSTVEQARTGQQEGSGAYRGHRRRDRATFAQEWQQDRVLDRRPVVSARTAGHDEGVEWWAFRHEVTDLDPEPTLTLDIPGRAHGHDIDIGVAVRCGGTAEDLEWPREVEHLHAVEQKDAHERSRTRHILPRCLDIPWGCGHARVLLLARVTR